MFIRSDNSLKIKWIIIAGVITLALVFFGIFLFDKPIYLAVRNTQCTQWIFGGDIVCVLSNVLAKLFNAKMWLGICIGISAIMCFKIYIEQKDIKQVFSNFKTSKLFYVLCSVFCASAIVSVLKVIIGRSRPILFEALDKVLFAPGKYSSVFNSMPSGHTTVTFAGLVMIGMLFPKVKSFTWSLAIIVGLSRIYVGAHWPSDVILGAFIGMITADLVKHFVSKNANK